MKITQLPKAAIAALTLSSLGFFTSAASSQEDRHVKIINETNVAMVRFFGAYSRPGGTEANILSGNALSPGEAIVVDFDDGSGVCLFDFRAVFADGVEMIREEFDVCTTPFLRYTPAG